jgi:hypothetical protein
MTAFVLRRLMQSVVLTIPQGLAAVNDGDTAAD